MIKKLHYYERPSVETISIEGEELICISQNGSNENYTTDLFVWEEL